MQHKEELPQYEKGLLKAMLNEIALTMDSMKQQNLKMKPLPVFNGWNLLDMMIFKKLP